MCVAQSIICDPVASLDGKRQRTQQSTGNNLDEGSEHERSDEGLAPILENIVMRTHLPRRGNPPEREDRDPGKKRKDDET